ncbi:ferrous iron transporter B [Actinotalea sp. M2MS4P-6]|uniref:ferrous iron transporter B n=1 Tax=Actinotalea sp. M2MS4P-6 TaxID=2983762 RepID=UPI0021E386B5|nr:ferrous iron transporter B [Actinotalea sp. M2MS4P-6]MCV2393389.1 ferrous iron transporter B [Actinotalea sp. M2MS4P-6]
MTATCHDPAPHAGAPAGTADIALVGPPNTGKSSVFNHLTGMRVKTANYPGVTVTRASGRVEGRDGLPDVILTDLPGTYGLTPVSPDEQVVADHVAGRLDGAAAPDALVLVVDSTTLRRSMPLIAAALATGRPCAVALTMTDELRGRAGDLDPVALGTALGVPVQEVVGHRGRGVPALRATILGWRSWDLPVLPPPVDDDQQLEAWTSSVLGAAAYRAPSLPARSRGIDRVLLHPVGGLVAFLLVMAAFFQTIFTVAAPLQGLIETAFAWLADLAAASITQPLLADLVGTALIGGVGGVLVFLPQIALLFLLLAVLEGSGYLARAAVLMDRVMALTGLDGRAFVSMLSSVACAVPGIMSTRTMPSSRDRLATMLTAPLMPCAARLPVYLLLVVMLVPGTATWGPFGVQGLVLLGLYLLGGLSALVAAAVLTRTTLRGGGLPFYLELPPYRVPSWRTVARTVGGAVGAFLRKMATVILVSSLVLWALMSFPLRSAETAQMPEAEASAYVLDHSWAASLGRAVEPVFAPLGFDWRTDVGLIGAMAAREVFVSTMGQVAAAEDPDNPADALAGLTWSDGPRAGEPLFTPPTIAALLVFFVYALQCFATIAVMRRESNSWRWPLLAFVGMGAAAWIMAWLARTVVAAVAG